MCTWPAAVPQLDDIDLSEHAVVQYRERAGPAVELAAARTELERLRSQRRGDDRAAWLVSVAGTNAYYLIIGDALALPSAP